MCFLIHINCLMSKIYRFINLFDYYFLIINSIIVKKVNLKCFIFMINLLQIDYLEVEKLVHLKFDFQHLFIL
jgi:hypothetical protein